MPRAAFMSVTASLSRFLRAACMGGTWAASPPAMTTCLVLARSKPLFLVSSRTEVRIIFWPSLPFVRPATSFAPLTTAWTWPDSFAAFSPTASGFSVALAVSVAEEWLSSSTANLRTSTACWRLWPTGAMRNPPSAAMSCASRSAAMFSNSSSASLISLPPPMASTAWQAAISPWMAAPTPFAASASCFLCSPSSTLRRLALDTATSCEAGCAAPFEAATRPVWACWSLGVADMVATAPTSLITSRRAFCAAPVRLA
mmetsp:Transcript_7736/g.32589  ORF Transcript_7736/g.32589 Transcript_7736/m.32589 type:complete len:257 (-) Transcript_7736:927-1697(-)